MMASVLAPAGRIEGRMAGAARIFLGIPYGEPPVGPLRWRTPVPVRGGGRVEATSPGPAPPQHVRAALDWMPGTRDEPMGEDCLNLDVYAPAQRQMSRPVIVHVFGGGFQGGSAGGLGIDGAGFVGLRDCVLVRPNLRIGALGFLHLADAFPDLDATNRGMLDLVLALEWVRDNIEAFGGDPERVTLAGTSSGAFTIAALLGCPRAEGLFHAAWLMSGSASRIIDAETASAVTREFLHHADVSPGDITALEGLSIETIGSAQEACLATDLGERNAPGGRTLGIVLDSQTLARHPMDALEEGRGRDVGLVFGSTANEARAWYATGVMPKADDAMLMETIERFLPKDPPAELRRLRERHPGEDATQLQERYLSEAIYRAPALRSAEAQNMSGGVAATYSFRWAPRGPYASLGAAHGFDESFVFDTSVPIMTGDPHAKELRDAMSGNLMHLARSGTPDWLGNRSFGSDRDGSDMPPALTGTDDREPDSCTGSSV